MTATLNTITRLERNVTAAAPAPSVVIDPTSGGVSAPRIVSLILLAGSVRRNELVEATGRSRLDLPLDARETVLNQWQREAAEWVRGSQAGDRPLRVLVDRQAAVVPQSAVEIADAPISIERDPQECRGTGGLLRDLAVEHADDHWLLVASAAQVLLEPLTGLIARLSSIEGDVRLLAHADRTPVGLMLIRCGCLRKLDRIGFVDLKEQALPKIARSHRVGVAMCDQPTSMPLLTCRDYLRAMRRHHLRRSSPQVLHDPFAEDWRCGFSVIEAGAEVDPTVHLHDSVVLRSARVEAGATVVRSLVSSGVVVGKNQVVTDQLLGTQKQNARR